MKFARNFLILLVLFIVISIDFGFCAPKKYNFVPAKCELHHTDKNIGGPLRVCTFPPEYAAVPQDEIDAVIEHIQQLNL